MATHVGRKLNEHFVNVETRLFANLVKNYLSIGCYNTASSSMFVNMDKTAIFIEAKSKSTVHRTSALIVSAKG